ncbi:hypothetical protein JVU11DRAFT_805 [Chiua virens]|nr:hypothetical protein JVU11DRAFT_805 [Chiua virens]
MSSSALGSDGKLYCKHMEEAVKRKSLTPKHPNREFYCCKRPPGDQSRCKFFVWADELHSQQSVVPASSPNLSRAHSTSAPRARPLQEHISPSSNPPETPRSGKRLEGIYLGLRERELALSPTRQPGPSRAIPQLPGIQTIPQPPSPVPTEPDGEVEAPLRVRSFLGLYDSPEPVEATIKDEGQPSTPKKRRLTPPPVGPAEQPATSCGAEALATPPETTRRGARSYENKRESDVVRSRKGKEREGAPPAPNDWDEDESGPSKGEEADVLPQFALPEDTSTTASASPTIAENVLDYSEGVKERVKALAEYLDSFDIMQAARTLQATERQKTQYEYRDQFQKGRIEELIAENDSLATEVTRLREALERSEDNNRVKDKEIAALKGGL